MCTGLLSNNYYIASLKYNSVNELIQIQGCKVITNLHASGNAKYTSPDVVKEMQQLSQWIKCDTQDEVQKSGNGGHIYNQSPNFV